MLLKSADQVVEKLPLQDINNTIRNSNKNAALITGGATRIGREIALTLAKQNWDIALHYHTSEKKALETREELIALGSKVCLISQDLSMLDQIKPIIDKSRAQLTTPITALINNASLFQNDDILSLDSQLWDQHMAINLKAPIFLSKYFAETMPTSLSGNIINLIDQRIAKLTPQFFSYTLSKSALATATTTLAQALSPKIRVNAICPGPTLKNQRQKPEDFEIQQKSTLLTHGASVKEISETVLYFLSTHSITGQIIYVDGGQRLIWKTADVWGIQE